MRLTSVIWWNICLWAPAGLLHGFMIVSCNAVFLAVILFFFFLMAWNAYWWWEVLLYCCCCCWTKVRKVTLWLPVWESISQQLKIMPLEECAQINSVAPRASLVRSMQTKIGNQYLTSQVQSLRMSVIFSCYILEAQISVCCSEQEDVVLDCSYTSHFFIRRTAFWGCFLKIGTWIMCLQDTCLNAYSSFGKS